MMQTDDVKWSMQKTLIDSIQQRQMMLAKDWKKFQAI